MRRRMKNVALDNAEPEAEQHVERRITDLLDVVRVESIDEAAPFGDNPKDVRDADERCDIDRLERVRSFRTEARVIGGLGTIPRGGAAARPAAFAATRARSAQAALRRSSR